MPEFPISSYFFKIFIVLPASCFSVLLILGSGAFLATNFAKILAKPHMVQNITKFNPNASINNTTSSNGIEMSGKLYRLGEKLNFYARSLVSLFALGLCAGIGVITSSILRLVGYGGLSQWVIARTFRWTGGLPTGVWFEIINGKPGQSGFDWLHNTRPAVLIGNHQTALDVLMLGPTLPPYCSVMSKRSLQWVPILGQFMTLSKTVFVDRANRSSAFAALTRAAETMRREKQSVYIFPEGTRSNAETPSLLNFKKGAFHLAIQAQVPVIPVSVANYSHLFSIKNKIFRSGLIPMKVLEPIETKGMTADDVDDLIKRTHAVMLKSVIELSKLAREWDDEKSDSKSEYKSVHDLKDQTE